MRNVFISIFCFIFLLFYWPLPLVKNLWNALVYTYYDIMWNWSTRENLTPERKEP